MKIYETNKVQSPHKSTIFDNPSNDKHEQIIYCHDEHTGLKAIIAIHNTVLGPALGGTRIWNYATEQEALTDVLRLSRGMTYKAAIAGLDFGGGKAVIIKDSNTLKTEGFLRKYGRCVNSLQGNYITAPDVNSTIADMVHVAKETQHVVSLPIAQGGSGDPSANTAYGTYLGMKAAAKQAYGSDSLHKKKIGVEGVGKVGYFLIDYLHKEGAELYITDIVQERLISVANQYHAQVVDPTQFYDLPLDIYAPCALGATLNDINISKLKCQIIVGAANNQLAEEDKHGKILLEKGILYGPDFLVNGGGLINASMELHEGPFNPNLVAERTEVIYTTCLEVFKQSSGKIPTQQVAQRMAEERIQSIKQAHLA